MDVTPASVSPPAEARQCLVEAATLASEGRLGGAAQKCERTLELSPNWAEAHELYGEVLEQMGFESKAQRAFEQASHPDALSYDVWAGLGHSKKWPDNLTRMRDGAMQTEPDPGTRQLLEKARDARDQGRLGSALRACETALERLPDWAEAHNLRGLILDDMGHPEKAIAAYMEAARLNPSFGDARRNLVRAGDALRDEGESEGMAVIRTFSFPSEAEIAQGRLEAEGLPAVVLQGEIVSMNWLFSPMVGWAKLCVRQEDAERALALLDQGPALSVPEERCPRCGSPDVHYEKYNLRWVYAFILLFRIPLPIRKDRWSCRHCGASW